MYATIRNYTNDAGLADALAARSDEVEELISTVPGFRGYFLVRTDVGCATITICDDKAGTEESTKRASQWLRDNAADIKSTPPQITSGEVLFQIGATTRV